MFGWFSTKEVDQLADSIVGEVLERFPQSGVDVSTKKAAEKAMKTLERMYSSISEFAVRQRPNLYQKARFGNRIKWALKDAGYSDAFIDIVTHEFLKQLALSSARPKRSA
jgi:nucleoside diphosphate kinase